MLAKNDVEFTCHEKYFIEYLVVAWNEYTHSYKAPREKGLWSCNSLEDAALKYKWKKLHRADNKKLLNELSKKLAVLLNKPDDSDCHDLHHVCLEILEWGGVEGVSSAWLRMSCSTNTLRDKINSAVELLKTGPFHKDWDRFNEIDLVMNSGLTKVYALADQEHIPIYDGRVGAGLGLLVRKYLEKAEHKTDEVPTELGFRWGAGQTAQKKGIQHPRNPSNNFYKFDSLRPGKDDHAVCCWRAGRLLREVVIKINSSRLHADKISLSDFGDALFMIGRIVHQKPTV